MSIKLIKFLILLLVLDLFAFGGCIKLHKQRLLGVWIGKVDPHSIEGDTSGIGKLVIAQRFRANGKLDIIRYDGEFREWTTQYRVLKDNLVYTFDSTFEFGTLFEYRFAKDTLYLTHHLYNIIFIRLPEQ